VAYILVILSVIALDQLTKIWVVSSFFLYESVEVIPGFFNLVYVVNTGAAFSILADVDSPWRHYFFLTIGLAAVIGLSFFYRKLKDENKYYSIPIGLIVGGAIGNLVDRVRLGAVVDFLDIYVGNYHWPAFNVADSAICVGAGVFIVMNFFDGKKNKQ